MIVVRLRGGLGNQMFQYAAGRSLALERRTALKLDTQVLLDRTPREGAVFREYNLDVFQVDPEVATREEVAAMFERESDRSLAGRIRQRLQPTACIVEPHFHFVESFFDLPGNTHLDGYWQSEEYFRKYEVIMRREFWFRRRVLPESEGLLQAIEGTTSVCVCVRRTDYLTNTFHNVCDMRYFSPAMRIMRERLRFPQFFVFSDDEVWCRENFTGSDVTIVGQEQGGADVGNNLQLRSRCRHFIVANSSLAWWAAWLGRRDETLVVAPKRWFADATVDSRDLVPRDWIRVDN